MALDQKEVSTGNRFGDWTREILSFAWFITLSALFYFSPKWDPMAGATSNKQAAMMVCALLLWYLVYLTWQGFPLMVGRVGSAFSLITDALFSLMPIAPVGVAIAFHLTGANGYELSFTNLVVATTTAFVAIFDTVVFGGIASLVNRLTNDVYTRGRNA